MPPAQPRTSCSHSECRFLSTQIPVKCRRSAWPATMRQGAHRKALRAVGAQFARRAFMAAEHRRPDHLDATVLICTYNRGNLLGETLDAIAKSRTTLAWEVAVVDNN